MQFKFIFMKLKILAIEWTRRAEFTNGRGNARRKQQTINKNGC